MLLAGAPAAAQITVRGACSVAAAPDRGALTATIVRRAPDAAGAADAASRAYSAFRAAVTALKLPDAVLRSNGIQTAQLTETDQQGHDRVTGYQGTASLDIETSAIARLAEAMQAAAKAGVDEVAPMRVFLSPAAQDRLVADCLPKAAADARAKAVALLRGLDLGIGAVQRVDGYDVQGGEMPPPGGPRPMAMRAMAAMAPPPDVSPGTTPITVSTTITFAIGH